MSMLNSSDGIVHVNIMIHRGGHVIVSYNVKPLFEGFREFCMRKIRQMVDEFCECGGKKMVFHIQVMMAGDMNGMWDQGYFKSHLIQLNSSSRCEIEVQSNLYKVY